MASSTSWYSPSGTSSDWMILPPLEVTEGAALTWRAKAADSRFADGYAVYVADATAITPEEFLKTDPLFSIPAESGEWTSRRIDLSQFAGKSVRIAFVNNSTDCSRLFIDDVEAGVESPLSFENTTRNMVSIGSNLELNGFIMSASEGPVTGISCTLEIAGETFTETFPDLVLNPGERLRFSWTTPFSTRDKGDFPYLLTVNCEGQSTTAEGLVRVVSNRVVMEEGTGTWCPNCVRGIVAMGRLAEKYPDNFIGVSIHNNGPMENETYTLGMVFSTSGIPKARIMRTDTDDPSNAETYFCRYLTPTPDAGVDLKIIYDEATRKVSAETEVSFADFYSDKDYRLAYAVIENNVHHPDDPRYRQKNGYAGGIDGEMGGWEEKPDPVLAPEMWYQEVARGMMTPFTGEPGIVPASMKALEKAEHTFTFTLPATVENTDETEILVFLIDGKTKGIVAAEKTPLNGESAVDTPKTGNLRILRTAEGLRIEGEEDAMTEVFSADGTLLARGSREITLSAKGLVIVAVHTGDGTVIRKTIL